MISNTHQCLMLVALLAIAAPLNGQKPILEAKVGIVYFSNLYGSPSNDDHWYSGSLLTQGYSSGSGTRGSGSSTRGSGSGIRDSGSSAPGSGPRSDPFSYSCRDLSIVKQMVPLDTLNYMAMSSSNLIYLTCRPKNTKDITCMQERCVPAANATHIASYRGQYNTYTLLNTVSNGSTLSQLIIAPNDELSYRFINLDMNIQSAAIISKGDSVVVTALDMLHNAKFVTATFDSKSLHPEVKFTTLYTPFANQDEASKFQTGQVEAYFEQGETYVSISWNVIGEQIIDYKVYLVAFQGTFVEQARQSIPLKNVNGYKRLITHGASGRPSYIPSVKNTIDGSGSPSGIIAAAYSRNQGMMAYVYDYGMNRFNINLNKESNTNFQGDFWFQTDSLTLFPGAFCFFGDSLNSVSVIYTATCSQKRGPMMKVMTIGRKQQTFLEF